MSTTSKGFSIIMPMDLDRLKQFEVTKRIYDSMPQVKEFLIPTRNHDALKKHLASNNLLKDVRLLSYSLDRGYNCSKALNLGIRESKYDQVIITSPEVKPTTPVLEQLEQLIGENVICQVHDEDEKGDLCMSLVNSSFRNDSPAYYFLAMFNKKDIEAINGWDEDFMLGYAYEDNDFGERWKRAGLPFRVVNEIQAIHQYHPRTETIPGGSNINFSKYNENNNQGIVRCVNGLQKPPESDII